MYEEIDGNDRTGQIHESVQVRYTCKQDVRINEYKTDVSLEFIFMATGDAMLPSLVDLPYVPETCVLIRILVNSTANDCCKHYAQQKMNFSPKLRRIMAIV